MTICERIFEIIEQKHLKAADLARKLEVKNSVLSNWKKRNTDPPMEYTIVVCEFLDVTPRFLITGKEEGKITPREQKLLEAYRTTSPGIQESIDKLLDIKEEYSSNMGKLSDSQIG